MQYLHDRVVEGQGVAAIKDGRTFRAFHLDSLLSTAKFYLLIATGGSPLIINRLHLSTSTSGKTILRLYDGTGSTGGSVIQSFNHNSLSTNISKAVIKHSVTPPALTTVLDQFVLFGESTNGVKADIGDTQSLSNYRIAAPNSNLLLEIENLGSDTDFFFKLFFSEKNPTIV